jgi:hypothetical protein
MTVSEAIAEAGRSYVYGTETFVAEVQLFSQLPTPARATLSASASEFARLDAITAGTPPRWRPESTGGEIAMDTVLNGFGTCVRSQLPIVQNRSASM